MKFNTAKAIAAKNELKEHVKGNTDTKGEEVYAEQLNKVIEDKSKMKKNLMMSLNKSQVARKIQHQAGLDMLEEKKHNDEVDEEL